MDRKKLLKHLVLLMFFIFVVNTFAQSFFWYYSIWYFDMPMHFLGGLWSSWFFIWFFCVAPNPFKVSFDIFDLKLFWKIIAFVLVIGILWEFFEFFTNNRIGQEHFSVIDTSSDIFFDLAGGAFGIYYFLRKIMRVELNKVE